VSGVEAVFDVGLVEKMRRGGDWERGGLIFITWFDKTLLPWMVVVWRAK